MAVATVRFRTHRLDQFARVHLGSDSTQNMANIVSWNADYFTGAPSIFLRLGEVLNIAPPVAGQGNGLLVNGKILVVNGRRLVL